MYDLNKDILLTIKADENFVAFSTWNKLAGRHGRFLVDRERLENWLMNDGGTGTFLDTDCGNFLRLSQSTFPNMACLRFDWLSVYSSGEIRGTQQTIHLNMDRLIYAVVFSKHTEKFVYSPSHVSSPVSCYSMPNQFQKITEDKRTLRAFSKAMRDNFQYNGEPVSLHTDGTGSFYFRTYGDFAIDGGLIRHESTVRVNGKEYPCVYFSVHT